MCNSRGFSNLGQEAARLNTSLRKYQQTLPSILGFSFTGGSRFIKASKSTFMFSTTTFNSSTLSLVLSMNKFSFDLAKSRHSLYITAVGCGHIKAVNYSNGSDNFYFNLSIVKYMLALRTKRVHLQPCCPAPVQ